MLGRTFAEVACAAGQCKIVEVIGSAMLPRDDVVDFKLKVEHDLGRTAVLAAMARAVSNGRVKPMRHSPNAWFPRRQLPRVL
jgi:hypothetical protein